MLNHRIIDFHKKNFCILTFTYKQSYVRLSKQ